MASNPSPSNPVHLRIEGSRAEIIWSDGKFNLLTHLWAEKLNDIVTQIEANKDIAVVLVYAAGKLFTAGLDLSGIQSMMSLRSSPPLLSSSPPASASLPPHPPLYLSTSSFPSFLSFLFSFPSVSTSPSLKTAKESKASSSSRFRSSVKSFQSVFSRLSNLNVPVVMAVHSKCIGGGVDLICAGDIRVCTADATFSIKETQAGLVADLGTIPRITRIIGKGLYNEMVFTGDPIDSERALSSGLVNTVYPTREEMLSGARSLCERIASNSPLVVAGAKQVLRYAEDHTVEDTLDYVALWNSAFIESEDLKEAVMSFMQKRRPVYKNRL